MNIEQALKQGVAQLSKTSPSPRIDTEVLLCFSMNKSRTFLMAYPEIQIGEQTQETFQELVRKRQAGWPIAYLTQSREFWSLPLYVTEDTLIPRPETELLVEIILEKLKDIPSARVLELGTGSGAIALAIASEKPNWQIQAVDISSRALQVAKKNAENLNIKNIRFSQSNWFDNINKQTFDAIVSNPPYIAEDDSHLSQGDVTFEPITALTSGKTGLEDIETITSESKCFLNKNGLLLLEHGYDQKEHVHQIFTEKGFQSIECKKDYQGNDRISYGYI